MRTRGIGPQYVVVVDVPECVEGVDRRWTGMEEVRVSVAVAGGTWVPVTVAASDGIPIGTRHLAMAVLPVVFVGHCPCPHCAIVLAAFCCVLLYHYLRFNNSVNTNKDETD